MRSGLQDFVMKIYCPNLTFTVDSELTINGQEREREREREMREREREEE